jgi:hypothetical protein
MRFPCESGGWPVGPHHLIAAPSEIPDRGAPDVNQPCEGKYEENGHTQEDMKFEDGIGIGDIG